MTLDLLGMMSGTSCDGIDVALVRFEAGCRPQLLHFSAQPMPEEIKEPVLRLAAPGIDEIDLLGTLDRMLGRAFADAALAALREWGRTPESIAAIANHGQTVRHRPRGVQSSRWPFTLQIGCAATLAEATGCTVISDFRRRDVAAGGEGAPLVPFAHRRLFAGEAATAVVNIGGIANITFLGADGSVLGFDTGPGNMVMDALMRELSDGRHSYDADGELAAGGRACTELLEQLLRHPFLARRPPKSTGREEFGQNMVDRILGWPELTDADRLATACEWTAHTIADALRFLPEAPRKWLICGGGADNSHLLRRLSALLTPAEVATTGDVGIPAAAVEAVSFAILGHETLFGRPNTLPAVTGARRPVCGGAITTGNNWSKLIASLKM